MAAMISNTLDGHLRLVGTDVPVSIARRISFRVALVDQAINKYRTGAPVASSKLNQFTGSSIGE